MQLIGFLRGLGLAGAAVTAVSAGSVLTAPLVGAQPDVTGKTYSEASDALSSSGYSPAVGTVVGSQLPVDECFVVGTTAPTFYDQMGSSYGEIRLNLSCYAEPASETSSGFSAGNNSDPAQAVREATAE